MQMKSGRNFKKEKGNTLMTFEKWEPSEGLQEVVGRAFDDILINRNSLLTVNPAPTGAGKSHLLPRRIINYIIEKSKEPAFNSTPDTIIIAAPNISQVSQIYVDFKETIAILMQDYEATVDAFFIPRQEQLLTRKGSSNLDQFDPRTCPAFKNSQRKKRLDNRYTELNKTIEQKEDTQEVLRDFMRAISAPCKSALVQSLDDYNALSGVCKKCLLMNPGGRIWSNDGPRFRVAFMTYARLIHGFRSAQIVSNEAGETVIQRSRYMPGGDGNYFKPIRNTAIFLEEAALGYERLWDDLVVDSKSVDLISYGQELARQVRTQGQNIIREIQAVIRSEQISCSPIEKEELCTSLDACLEKRLEHANKFYNTFYMRTSYNSEEKVFKDGRSVELRLVRSPNVEADNVKLVQPVDVSLSFLSNRFKKSQLAYIAEHEEGTNIPDQYRVVVGPTEIFSAYEESQENLRAGDLRLMIHFFYEFIVRPSLGFILRLNQDLKSWVNQNNKELLEALVVTKLDQLRERIEARLDDTEEVFSTLLQQK